VVGWIEKPRRLPGSITEAVLGHEAPEAAPSPSPSPPPARKRTRAEEVL